jgi:PDZ domain-containing protein
VSETAAPEVRVQRRRRWPTVLVVVLLVVVVTGWGLTRWNVNYYALTPGDAIPVTPYIEVPHALDHQLHGQILLTDVYLVQLNALSYLQDSINSDDQIYSAGDLIGPESEQQYLDQGFLEMSQAQTDATAAALSQLGYSYSARNAGVLIDGIIPSAPAARVLKVAQIITKVNGTATPTPCALVNAMVGLRPGSTATLGVEQSYLNDVGDFVAGPTVAKTVKLEPPPKEGRVTGCGPPVTQTAIIGIDPESQLDFNFPVKVTVHTSDIGGPSAGLAMALGIIDKLSGGHLTGNRIVAATGEITAQGDVEDVGGVPQKTIAVERAGATVFFVPPQELSAARSKATPQLHVYAVSTLAQALRILKHLGGTMPAKHVLAQAAP